MWEARLLRDIADRVERTVPELSSKLYTIALNIEDIRKENAELNIRLKEQLLLIQDLRARIRRNNI